MRAPFSRLHDATVFAVDATEAQLVVSSQEPVVEVEIDGSVASAQVHAGIAVVELTGLAPATTYSARISGIAESLRFTTRAHFGETLASFATISDIHVGLEEFGIMRRLADTEPGQTLRSARAAVSEATAWGARTLLIKGDITQDGQASEWSAAPQIFSKADPNLDIVATVGNHDVKKCREIEPRIAIEGLTGSFDAVQVRSLPGVEVLLVDTTITAAGHGRIQAADMELIIELARGTDDAVFIGFHHNLQRTPLPWFWPPGITPNNWKPLVAELDQRTAPTILSSGHTHRNRLHRLGRTGRVSFTEVSSTSDFPGVWAGYEVTEQGVRQTTRRIADPNTLRWSENAKRAVSGVWPRWSIGRLEDRCVDATYR